MPASNAETREIIPGLGAGRPSFRTSQIRARPAACHQHAKGNTALRTITAALSKDCSGLPNRS
jgi:hypothetical protein